MQYHECKQQKNNLVVVKLYKKLFSREGCSIFRENKEWYDSFGYYDKIGFVQAGSAEELIQSTIKNTAPGLEQVILIPAEFNDLDWSKSVGSVSFLIIDESLDTDLFSLAKSIEQNLRVDQAKIRAFVTMGASAIAVICFCEKSEKFVSIYHDYLNALLKLTSDIQEIVYTFTIQFMRVSEVPRTNETLRNVYISFICKTEMLSSANKFLDSVKTCLGGSCSISGVAAGTDDYFVFAQNVPAENFLNLFDKEGLLCLDADHDHYVSSFTSLGFDTEEIPSSGKKYSATPLQLEPVDLRCLTDNRYLPVRELEHSFKAYNELRNSVYTRWAYRYYNQIVSFCIELLQIKLENPEYHIQDTILDGYTFVQELNQMLEALLNTSAYFTDSPGYRTVEYNCLPRLLLCYQKEINLLVEEWDAGIISRRRRKHVFFLYVKEGSTVQASMLFRYLPPDERLICVCVPIYFAYQPATLLPLLLHEAGHYVGVRNRGMENATCANLDMPTRKDFFIRLTVQRFFAELYQEICGKSMWDSLKSFHEACMPSMYGVQQEYDYDAMRSIHALLSMYEGCAELLEEVNEAYTIYVESYEEVIRSENFKDPYKNKNMIYQNYFTEMSAIVTSIFTRLFKEEPDRIIKIFSDHYILCIQQMPLNERRYQALYQSTEKSARDALVRILDRITAFEDHSFIRESEKILSEVAADMFMVNATKMKSYEYLCLVFEQYVYGPQDLKDIVRSFSNTPVAYMRVLSIYKSLANDHEDQAGMKAFESKRICAIAEFTKLDKEDLRRNYDEFKAWILEASKTWINGDQSDWVSHVRDLILPVRLVEEYVDTIKNDERYTKEPEAGSRIQKIRDIYRFAVSMYQEKPSMELRDLYYMLYKA